jgi:hypothetical protein
MHELSQSTWRATFVRSRPGCSQRAPAGVVQSRNADSLERCRFLCHSHSDIHPAMPDHTVHPRAFSPLHTAAHRISPRGRLVPVCQPALGQASAICALVMPSCLIAPSRKPCLHRLGIRPSEDLPARHSPRPVLDRQGIHTLGHQLNGQMEEPRLAHGRLGPAPQVVQAVRVG